MVAGQGRPYLTTTVRNSYAIRDVDLAGPADSDVSNAQSMPPVGFREGSLVQLAGDANVYIISDGRRRRFVSSQLFSLMGYKSANIWTITPAELALHLDGPPIQ